MLGLYLDALGRRDEARAAIRARGAREAGLEHRGFLRCSSVPIPTQSSAAWVAPLREYWPKADQSV
jgi:hypothetical protein